jgi:hypothetical protein
MKTTIIVDGSVTIVQEKPKTHLSFNLQPYDKALLVACVESRLAEVQKILEFYPDSDEVEGIHNDAFDLQGLLAMIKESEQLKSVISKDVVNAGWTFRGHNVDMPTQYSKGEGLDEKDVEETSI